MHIILRQLSTISYRVKAVRLLVIIIIIIIIVIIVNNELHCYSNFFSLTCVERKECVRVGVVGADGLRFLAFSETVLRFLALKLTVLRFPSF